MAKGRKKRGGGRLAGFLLAAVVLLLAVSLWLRYGDFPRDRLAAADAPDKAAAMPPGADAARDSLRLAAALMDSIPAEPLRVQILNATGLPDLALEIGEQLRVWNVDALDRGNAPPWPFPETLLVRRSERAADVEILARRLGNLPLIVQRRDDLMLDATLILGHDWESYPWPRP